MFGNSTTVWSTSFFKGYFISTFDCFVDETVVDKTVVDETVVDFNGVDLNGVSWLWFLWNAIFSIVKWDCFCKKILKSFGKLFWIFNFHYENSWKRETFTIIFVIFSSNFISFWNKIRKLKEIDLGNLWTFHMFPSLVTNIFTIFNALFHFPDSSKKMNLSSFNTNVFDVESCLLFSNFSKGKFQCFPSATSSLMLFSQKNQR